MIKYYKNIFILFALCVVGACMPFKTAYHDLNLHYNKFFIAKEKLKEAEQSLAKQHKDDYNKPLQIYPECDSIKGKALKPQLEECMKKASLGIDWHGGVYWTRDSWQGYSKWADDAYILIGKARMYANDFKNAKETFKYVNTKGKDKNDKHTALIWLMQVYTRNGEYYNAKDVMDILSKEKMNKKNEREFLLSKAYLHQLLNEYPQAVKSLQKAIPLTPIYFKREIKARYHFITGQIYQMYDKDSSAYINYKKCIKNNPPYELGFYAKLYASQVAPVHREADVQRIKRYFKKLLKDPKNTEYKDKIYYEMGGFEAKQNNYDQAITYYNLSTKANSTSPTQKGYTYLKLAEIYYNKKNDYQQAKYYYDSTLLSLPKDHPQLKQIEKLKNILDEFVKHYKMMNLQDSLQKLAKLDTSILSKKLDQIIEQDYLQQKKAFMAKKLADKKANQKSAADATNGAPVLLNNNTIGSNDKFYFYNPDALNAGKADFFKKWGNRPLEDDWRRSTKEKVENNETTPENKPTLPVESQTKETTPKNEPQKDKDGFSGTKLVKADLYKGIPLTKSSMEESQSKLTNAIFSLGKIYHFKLEEIDNAVTYYKDKLIEKNPGSAEEPEALYLLYLIQKELKNDQESQKYKETLITKHPKSNFAKQLVNPNWRKELKEENSKLQLAYKEVFTMYEQKQYLLADSSLDLLLNQYPKNEYEDKMRYLKTLIKARTSDKNEYKTHLQAFIKDYADSPLATQAKNILSNMDKPTTPIVEPIQEKQPVPTENKIVDPTKEPNNQDKAIKLQNTEMENGMPVDGVDINNNADPRR